ncbi:uncharacterized protein [Musca autumnalis]|uniref:uncharacterized protein n=1 Tax=Musca autumnalis TaxID=221902 RepID=UPI003CF3F919
MSESFCIKTENSNNDTLSYNTTKLENCTNMENDIEEDELNLDNMEEFLPENVDKAIIDIIKKEDVEEMEEFLPEDSYSIDSPSSLTWKSDDRSEVTTTITQQISRPKLEIIDVHTDEQDSKGLKINGDTDVNGSDNKERYVISSSRVAQISTEHKCELRNEHASSTDKKFVCEICNQRFKTKIGLGLHYYRTHQGAHSQYKCEQCDSPHVTEKSLRKHIRDKHPSSLVTEYICNICNQNFTTQNGLDKHCYWMHPKTEIPSKHKCEICGSCYGKSLSLRYHISKKHPSSIDTEYICKICNQKFATQKGLDKHSFWKHPETLIHTKHGCELCDSSYKYEISLHRHIREKHPSSIDTEYICQMCNQRFATKISLDKHSYRKHPKAQTPGKHKCEICGTCYTESHSLRTHIKNKHPSSIDADYICEMCQQRFTTQKGLDRHCKKMH